MDQSSPTKQAENLVVVKRALAACEGTVTREFDLPEGGKRILYVCPDVASFVDLLRRLIPAQDLTLRQQPSLLEQKGLFHDIDI